MSSLPGGRLPPQQISFADFAAADPYTLDEYAAQIRIQPYHFLARNTWTATFATAVDHYVLPLSVEAGTIAVGLATKASKGVFCMPLPGGTGTASTVTTGDDHNLYANAIAIRRPLDGTATAGLPLSINDGTADRIVFGLLQCASTVTDGATAGATDRQISFVYEDSTGALQPTSVGGTIEFEMLFAVSNSDYPYTLI